MHVKLRLPLGPREPQYAAYLERGRMVCKFPPESNLSRSRPSETHSAIDSQPISFHQSTHSNISDPKNLFL
jgi:hypothetical protein